TEHLAKVIGIEKSVTTGIARQRDESFLSAEIGVVGIEGGLAGVSRGSAQAGGLRFPARDHGFQAARVQSVYGSVGADCGGHGSAQLRLVFNSGAINATGEVEDGFFLVYARQRVGEGAQGFKSAIGVEDVVFSLVGGKRLRRICGALGSALFVPLTSVGVEARDGFREQPT